MCTSCNEGAEVIHLHAHKYISLGLEKRHRHLSESDELIAKVLSVSEVARIARIEVNLRKFYLAKWELRQAQAVKKATELASQLKKPEQIAKAIHSIMRQWAGDVKDHASKEQARIYKLAREAGWKKATGRTSASLSYDTPNMTDSMPVQKATAFLKPSFNLVDTDAVAALNDQQMFWIGSHYEQNVQQSINDITRKSMIEAGKDRQAAGALMSKHVKDNLSHIRTPAGFAGTSAQYFEGLAANAATVGRVYGQLRSFMEIGITQYTIVNPGGLRTCEVCLQIAGKVFTVQQAATQMEMEMQAKTPAGIKSIHPWKTPAQVKQISPQAGPIKGAAGEKDSQRLHASGLSYPPYHFRCRCTVDVDTSSQSYSDLQPMVPPTRTSPAKPLAPMVKPKPAARKPKPAREPKPFDNKVLGSALARYDPGKTRLSGVEAKAIRQQTNNMLQSHGLNINDDIQRRVGRRWYYTRELFNASGMHEWDGTITLTPNIHRGAMAFFSQGSRKKGALRGAKTLVHEAVHGSSPMAANAYRAGGAVVEEVTTEVAARHILQSTFKLSSAEMAQTQSYQKFISKVTTAIYDNMGYSKAGMVGMDQAKDALVKASMAMRSDPIHLKAANNIASPGKYMEYFASKVEPAKGVTAAAAKEARKNLVSAVSKMSLDPI